MSFKFEATPSWKLFSSRSMSHMKPYPSSPLGLIWVTVLQLVLVSLENWRRFIKEPFWFWLWWWWWWLWVTIEDEKLGSWLHPTCILFWLVGHDEAKVRDGGVASNMSCGLSLALLSALPLWKTLHKTQSSCIKKRRKKSCYLCITLKIYFSHKYT